MSSLILFICFFLAASFPAKPLASEPTESSSLASQAPILIEAKRLSRVPMPNDGKLLGNRTLLSHEMFENTQQSVADVLRTVPGLTLTQSGGDLSATRVTIRGSKGHQVLIVVDGTPVNHSTASPAAAAQQNRQGLDLASLSLDQVERIEIIRGPASAIYGPGAASGVISIQTKLPHKKELLLENVIGTSAFRKRRIQLSAPWKTYAFLLEASQQESSGEYLFFDPHHDENEFMLKNTGNPCAPSQGNGFRLRKCNESQQEQLRILFERTAQEQLQFHWSRLKRQGLGGILDSRPDGEETQTNQSFNYHNTWSLTDRQQVGLQASVQQSVSQRTENQKLNEYLERIYRYDTTHANAWSEMWFAQQSLKWGLDYQSQMLDDPFFKKQREIYSPHLNWQTEWQKLSAEAHIRMDHYSDLSSHGSYQASGSYYVSPHYGFKATQSTGYRPPSLFELYDPGSPRGPSPANPDLQSESSFSRSFGMFREDHPQHYIELIWFEQHVRDQIIAIADPKSPTLFRFENLSKTQSRGLEASAHFRLKWNFSIDISYTQINSIIVDNEKLDKRHNGNQIPGVSSQQWQSSLYWEQGVWNAYLKMRHQGERFIDTANTRSLTPYEVIDAGFNFPIGFQVEGSLTAKNLTNTTYAELENYPPPGRQLYLALRWRLTP